MVDVSKPDQDKPIRSVVPDWTFGVLVALFGYLIGSSPISDNSFLTHVATGRLIWDNGSIPTVDTYSFSAHGAPWVVQSWLASVIYGGVDRAFGLNGLLLINGLLCAVVGWLMWLMAARSERVLTRFTIVLIVMVLSFELLSGRPLLFGLIGFQLVYLACQGRFDARWLIGVAWVWANTHGSFPYGFALILAMALGTRFDGDKPSTELRVLKFFALGTAMAAINPIGPKLLVFPLTAISKREQFSSIQEWQAPSYSGLTELAVLGLFVLTIVLVARNTRWRDLLPLLGFGVLGLTALRNQMVLLIVIVPILAGTVPVFGSRSFPASRLMGRAVAVLVMAFALIAGASRIGGKTEAFGGYPVASVRWMDAQGLWGPKSRVMAPDYVGNYREFTKGEDARVYLDDRVDMYPADVFEDGVKLLDVEPESLRILDDRRISAVLWQKDRGLVALLEGSPKWQRVHTDKDWAVFVRAG